MFPYDEYFRQATIFSEKEKSLREHFAGWLPDNIIDCHAHSNLASHVIGLPEMIRNHIGSTFLDFGLDRSRQIKDLFFTNKCVRTLRFSHPMQGIDFKAANDYLLLNTPAEDRVALCGIPTDIGYTVNCLRKGFFSALKMYYAFFVPPAEAIYDFFRPEILEEAQAEGVPIILHLPSELARCRQDFGKLLSDFPRLKISLAHLGQQYLPEPDLPEIYGRYAASENIFLDTSWIMSSEVIETAIRVFGTGRIMFGTDEPLNLIKANTYTHPQLGERLITEYKYHWVDHEEHSRYGRLAKGATHIHWRQLAALKEAIKNIFGRKAEAAKERIFYENARELFGF